MKIKRLLSILLSRTFLICGTSLVLLASLFTSSAWALFEERPSSARAWGMGGAFTAVADDSSAIYFNPAGLTQLEFSEVSGSYTRIHSNKDQELMGASLAQPLGRFGALGAGWLGYGSDIYSEDTYTLSYGKRIFRNGYLGASFKDYELEIKTIGKDHDYGIDLGFLYRLMDGRLRFGLFGSNLNNPNIGKDDLPQRYAGGVSYQVRERFTMALDYVWFHREAVEQEDDEQFRLGFEYQWLKHFFFRSGVSNNPGRWTTGLGLKFKYASMDYAYLNHHNLDPTHLATLTFRFNIPWVARIVKEEEVIPEEEVVPEKKIPVIKVGLVPISSITEANIGKKAILKGEIKYVRVFKEEKGRTLEINDGTGSINVLIWKDLYEYLPERERLIPGTSIQVKGRITSYMDELEIHPKKTSDIQILEVVPVEEAIVPVEEEKPPVEEVVPEEIPVEEEVPPVPEVVPPPKVEEKVPELIIEEIVHIVEEGETLTTIAQRYFRDASKYKKLARENDIKDPDHIYPGQEIKIRVIWKP